MSTDLVMDTGMIVILALKLGTIPMGKLFQRARLEDQIVLVIRNSMAALTLTVELEFSNKTRTTVWIAYQSNNQTNLGWHMVVLISLQALLALQIIWKIVTVRIISMPTMEVTSNRLIKQIESVEELEVNQQMAKSVQLEP